MAYTHAYPASYSCRRLVRRPSEWGDFKLEEAPRESQTLFSHSDAEARFGASVFWVREGMLTEEQMREFLDTWQLKRDGTYRGILEVKP